MGSRVAVSNRLPLASCVLAGLLIALLPHLLEWLRTGHALWISGDDELTLYLPYAARVLFKGGWQLTDPAFSEARATSYPWIQFFPAAGLARLLGAGPEWIGIFWRILAGATIAAGWYCVLRGTLRASAWACAAIAVCFLCEPGTVQSRLVVTQLTSVFELLGRPAALFPRGFYPHPEWRIITPALSWGFLLFYFAALARAVAKPAPRTRAWAGLALGALIWAYFYFWTAAVAALALCLLIDRKRWRTYASVGAFGGLVGLPAIVHDAHLKLVSSSDWLTRTDKFIHIGHFSELQLSKSALALLAVSGWLVLKRRKELRWLWAYAAASLLLLNHQLVSGLMIENFHWNYALGPALCLLVAALGAEAWRSLPSGGARQVATLAVCLLGAADVAAGVWLRAQEPTRSPDNLELMESVKTFRSERLAPGAPRMTPDAVIAGDPGYVSLSLSFERLRPLYSPIAILSPWIAYDDFNTRFALDRYLRGFDEKGLAREGEWFVGHSVWGPWHRDPIIREKLLGDLQAAFRAVRGEPARFLERYQLRYLALSHGSHAPPGGGGVRWRRRAAAEHWDVWERE